MKKTGGVADPTFLALSNSMKTSSWKTMRNAIVTDLRDLQRAHSGPHVRRPQTIPYLF